MNELTDLTELRDKRTPRWTASPPPVPPSWPKPARSGGPGPEGRACGV
ncbi:hypothetical protein [Sphaerisporangium fuscum]|nr:hypothetical protein [Sphaerisporangium fuscum]